MKRQPAPTALTRRKFLKTTAALGATIALTRLSAKSYAQVAGANNDIRVAVVGCNTMGAQQIRSYLPLAGVRVTAVCDVDSAILRRAVTSASAGGRPAPATFADVRKLLENKDIDAISVATPNHWHALMTIWACQAGKDVYMEKPVSHNIWEGQQSVAAARKYDRIVQAGTQWRSMPQVFEAIEFAKSGKLGKILVSRGLCYKPRPSIGNVSDTVRPNSVDYDLWCGPASKEQRARGQFHYDWHWFWETGNGDIANQGAHQMDLAMWALGETKVAPSVISLGGRIGYQDNGETPNTMITVHDYAKAPLIFEVRGLPTRTGAGNQMDLYRNADIGNVIECENGYVSITQRQCAAYDNTTKLLQTFNGSTITRDRNHYDNFIKAMRSRKRETQNCELADGALSSYLCHLSNISLRVGKQTNPDEAKAAFTAPAAKETLTRLLTHLDAHSLNMDGISLGAPLKIDPETIKITNNEAASKLLTRTYREPFIVPETV